MDGNTIVSIWIIMSLLHTAIITVDVAVNSGKIQMEKGKGKMKITRNTDKTYNFIMPDNRLYESTKK